MTIFMRWSGAIPAGRRRQRLTCDFSSRTPSVNFAIGAAEAPDNPGPSNGKPSIAVARLGSSGISLGALACCGQGSVGDG
jgi:hypothetical protein